MKKLSIYLVIIIALFSTIFFINRQSDKVKYGNGDSQYGVPVSKLHRETVDLLNDPNYQNIILPNELEQKIKNKEDFFVYFFASNCIHCRNATPVLMPIAKQANVHIDQFNLLEFQNGWDKYDIESTPTLVYYKDGKQVERIVGAHPADNFQSFIEKNK